MTVNEKYFVDYENLIYQSYLVIINNVWCFVLMAKVASENLYSNLFTSLYC